ELRREHVMMSVVWKPGYPNLVALTDDIAEKKQAVLSAIRELNIGDRGGSNLWQRRQALYEQIVNLKSRYTALDIRSASLEKLLSGMVKGLPALADQSFEYEQLLHESEQVRKQFDRMLEKEFEIRTALSRGSATVEWRDAVVLTNYFQGRNFPVSATALLGALIGLIAGIGFAMMLEMMDTSIQSTEDVNHALNLEVIGMIPMMKFAKGRGLSRRRRRQGHVVTDDESAVDACIVTQHDPKSPISEAYRSFRTNFQFATIQSKPKTMMVTSSVPGEGKTTTAVNFAVTMADRGMRVLIVDTDLRRPNVHRVLKMERGSGLADVLREETPLKDVIRSTRVENLWIISSGRVPKNPSELIGSDRMGRLMNELGATFDLVVCDAPSILVVTDPVLLATNVDSVVLVVAVNHARQETIQRAKKLLDTTKAEIAGVVMNGLEATARHYYYYYYYYDDAASPKNRIWN
ncbi:MAG: polysaccharide biosynthesis tyrosine autokinase, partial [Candidatus Hydrogenedentes bacterium]|nr:polysaccharide biosynthesis tyrosine autokinase [Candidatus Hydrogenedentota bacterium]